MARQFKPGQLQTGALFNISSSYALTASFAFNAVSAYFIATGSVTASVNATGDIFIIKSGSYNPFTVSSTGLTTISGSATNLFLINNASNQPVLTVSQSGVLTLTTSSVVLTGTAPNGAIYFTSNYLFVGLD